MDIQSLDPKKKHYFHRIVNEFEKELIAYFLTHNNGEVKATADILSLQRTTLHERIKRLGLDGLKRRKPRSR